MDTDVNATPENTAVVTISCYDQAPDTVGLMLESAKRLGIRVTVFSDKPKSDWMRLKVTYLLKCIRILPPEIEHVLYVDSRDVLFVRPMDAICDVFNAIGWPMLMSAENKCWPHRDPAWSLRFPYCPRGFNYHGAGVFMGERDAVESSLMALHEVSRRVRSDKVPSSAPFLFRDDQHLWQAASLEGNVDVRLDSKQELFCSFHMNEWGDYCWGKSTPHYPVVTSWGPIPSIVHFASVKSASIHMFYNLLVQDKLKDLK
jgi:hypothetical protein